MFRMPISGTEVELRHATGAEDLLLLESDDDLAACIALVERLAAPVGGGVLDARALTVTDLEALLLELRRKSLGDLVVTHGRCSAQDCAAPVDVTFPISQYMAHHTARTPAFAKRLEQEPGWFQLCGSEVLFRMVTAADLAAAARSANPERELAGLTIRSRQCESTGRLRRKAEQAMEMMAPPLSGEVNGVCPQCGATVRFWFDVQRYVLRELRYDAQFLYADVNQLAASYHWTEEQILSLPRQRRMQYVDMALEMNGGR
jgi:hypothetical protein